MSLLITIVFTVVAVVVLHKPLHKAPMVFYIIAILLDMLLVANAFIDLPRPARTFTSLLMQEGTLGVAMFFVVMYIGVFSRDGKVSRMLRPVRAELSILSCLLIAGHMVFYLMSYIRNIFGGALPKTHVLAGFIIALALLVLILVLGITSARFVKRKMRAGSWKKLQRFSYLFYALIFVHLLLMLGPSALHGSSVALTKVVVYAIVFVAYFVLRIIRYMGDKRDKVDIVDTVMDQGFTQK